MSGAPLYFQTELQRLMAAFDRRQGMSMTQIESWWAELGGPSESDIATAVDRTLKDPSLRGYPSLAVVAGHLPKHRSTTSAFKGITWDVYGAWRGDPEHFERMRRTNADDAENIAMYILAYFPDPGSAQIRLAELFSPGSHSRFQAKRSVAQMNREAAQVA